ncbi:endolytic transglycosylase MltG [Jiella sp. MQZ9-1]|uniref:endolytic transglycosylase MltG n=1 Tax=Jiella flava TaxID=2816857 RepID=UPI001E2B7587|nr:endolytic transglycosylase MltG [Jiella flava]
MSDYNPQDGQRESYRRGRDFKPSPAPEPPKRSRHARNQLVIFLNFCLSAVFFLTLTVGAVLYWGKLEFDGPGPLTKEATYVVPRSTGVSTIADGLERDGIISNASIFEFGVRLSRAGGQLKAGEYAFAPGASMRDIMNKLKSGDSIMHSVTIPEGWTVHHAYERIESANFLSGPMPGEVAEGTLRPDTYLVQRGTTRKELVHRMQAAQNQLVKTIWEGRDKDLPIKDIGQFLTLASIVERETGIDGERAHVASVFLNRLKKGMRLDSDPTFLYGVYGGGGKPSDKPVTQSDKDSDTPYNTYRIRGLPPGPIANPGKAALEAVAHPMQTDDLYFVADGTGGHVFSATLKEHNANVAKYRQLERERQAQQDGAGNDGG